ncbi:uncharacterized protein PFL1_02044 [Pseudozyma flocculosa PF-1]|uniref:Uncharacterized protein n=1 Tax=Pseudozyma flocculosa TaxID=84751 RepID=A0A5C3F1L3_9BASI|nr:uncharacterized protein PFL1_02044 [Pseudozyma flocculosa PF-1]EPQ30518.1 hypothetical protein PFL1_02044 [Pseudozyma flocculosa PF-1]SPO37607.1 uncharacterized protein PSFLO_03082 [Pseudozyma flocculosa]
MSSPKQSTEKEPLFIDPSHDPTFQSLSRLLSAPASSTQHLSLLSTNTLFGSITYYLSKLELEHVGHFIGVLTASGCLWTPPPPAHQPLQPQPSPADDKTQQKVAWSTESRNTTTATATPPKDGATSPAADKSTNTPPVQSSTEAPQSLSAFLISRSTAILHAVASAFDRRVALLIQSTRGSVTWKTRRGLKLWIESIVVGMSEVEASAQPESFRTSRGLPIPRLAVLTGLLQGLYLLRDQRRRRRNMSILEEMAAIRANPSLELGARPFRSFVEDEWIVSFAEILDALSDDPLREDVADASTGAGGQGEGEEADDWEREFQKRTAQLAGSAQITALSSRSAKLQALREIQDVPLFLASQLAPLMPDKKLHALNTEQLARVTSEAILSLFEGGPAKTCLLSHLSDDVGVEEVGGEVILNGGGTTVHLAQSLSRSTLHSSLGPLSKLLSKALARESTAKDPDSLGMLLMGSCEAREDAATSLTAEPILQRMDRLAKDLERNWLSSPLAGVPESGIAEASRAHTAQLWTIFKTLLFSYTMAFDSLMDAILQMCPSPTVTFPPAAEREGGANAAASRWPPASTSNLPQPYIRIVQSILETFSHLYWITSTFGSQGFDVYRKVFFSALDVLGRDGEGCIALLERIRPDASPSLQIETNAARRSLSTYFLDVSEQLLPALPDEVIEQLLLPTCRPYLEDTQFKETFESAHSVALAVYTHRRRCMFDLAPFYIDLLLSSYPDRLDDVQLEFAVTTVVGALADRSDSVCWWVVERVAQAIDEERKREHQSGKTTSIVDATATDPATEPTPTELQESAAASASASSPSSASTESRTGDETAKVATAYPRLVTLQLVLIACVPCVNLVLLRSILAKAETYILEHKRQEDDEERASVGYRKALCEKTFDALQALNAATREEGVRWWLDKRAAFGV